MASIFLQLTEFNLRKESLQKITGSAKKEQIQDFIDDFYEQELEQFKDYAQFFIKLCTMIQAPDAKDKLLLALVYFTSKMQVKDAIDIFESVLKLNQPVLRKVKFLSYAYKSIQNQKIKQWLLSNTVIQITTIESSGKISPYASFVQNFGNLVETLELSPQETLEMYVKLINYLQKHPVYKKLCSSYVIKSLKIVTEKNAQSEETTGLMMRFVKYGNISDSAMSLLANEALKKNKSFPLLQMFLTGYFQNLDMKKVSEYEKSGVKGQLMLRKMKIEAIPRLLNNIKTASYQQIAELLKVQKDEVESYIIEAIKQGLIKAKLDQFEQQVIVSRVNFRALRKEERVKLQNDISELCKQIESRQ